MQAARRFPAAGGGRPLNRPADAADKP